MTDSDAVGRRLLAAERAVWTGIKRVEHGDMVDHYERMVELQEANDLDSLWEYTRGLMALRDAPGPEH